MLYKLHCPCLFQAILSFKERRNKAEEKQKHRRRILEALEYDFLYARKILKMLKKRDKEMTVEKIKILEIAP